MKNGKYFTLKEMTKSSTAKANNIDNTPDFEIVENLNLLIINLLDPMREAYGKAIKVTSGFRCPALNKIVGGVENSQHMKGQAADIVPADGTTNEFITWIQQYLKGKDFDQCIIETSKKTGGKWIHISWKKTGNRKKIFELMAK